MTSELDRLVARNAPYAATTDHRDLPMPPARGLAILTCMDARFDPLAALDLDLGEAHVIRNAGGRATDDAVRSLAISVGLGGTREVAVVHHTACALEGKTHDEVVAEVAATLGVADPPADFLPFADLDGGVRDDVATLRAQPVIAHAGADVRGYVYDVVTGALRAVD